MPVMARTTTVPSASRFSTRTPQKLPAVKPAAKAAKQAGSLRFCMVWPMANSHSDTSKKPSSGASSRQPRDRKMMCRVPRVTTDSSAAKTTSGSGTEAKSGITFVLRRGHTTQPRKKRPIRKAAEKLKSKALPVQAT